MVGGVRFVTRLGWEPFKAETMLLMQHGRRTFQFRAEEEARFYLDTSDEFETEVLAAVGVGDLEIEVVGWTSCWVRFESAGRVWRRADEVAQTTRAAWGTVFTEPMHRPQMSPEMRMIQRIQRENQLARERLMHDFEQRLATISARGRRGSDTGQNGEEGGPRSPESVGDGGGGGETPPKSGSDGSPRDQVAVTASESTGDGRDGRAGDKGSGKAGDPAPADAAPSPKAR